MLRVLTAFSVAESDATSRRRKAQYARWRREGKVRAGGRGGRAFGFKTDGVTHIPAETVIVRELAGRVLAGESAGALARELTSRNVKTPAGNGWSHQTLRKMLARPRYAGLMPDGQSPGAWEPVLDREMWEATVAALDAKAAGFGYATNARKYLLSGIAICSECKSGLQIRAEHRRTHQSGYGCVTPGCRKVQRSVRLLDAYVTRRVVRRLSHDANPAGQIPAAPGLAAQFAALATQRAETVDAISDPAAGAILGPLRARLENIDQRVTELRELAAGDARHQLLSKYAGISEDEFGALPLAVQRALVAACYTVTVLPASARGPGFRTGDVRLTPR